MFTLNPPAGAIDDSDASSIGELRAGLSLLGNPSAEEQQAVKDADPLAAEKLRSALLPQGVEPYGLARRLPAAPEEARELVKGLLGFSPSTRWSAAEALHCAFFKPLRDAHPGAIEAAEKRGLAAKEGAEKLFQVNITSANVRPLFNSVMESYTPGWAAGCGAALHREELQG